MFQCLCLVGMLLSLPLLSLPLLVSPPVQVQCYFNTTGSKIHGNVLVILLWSGLDCARGACLPFPDIPGTIFEIFLAAFSKLLVGFCKLPSKMLPVYKNTFLK